MNKEVQHKIRAITEAANRNQKRITALALLAFGLLLLQQERPVQHHSYPYETEIIPGSLTLTSEITTIPFPLITRVARFADITQFDMEMSLRESNDGYEATSLPALEWLKTSNDAIFVMNGSFFDPVKYNLRDRMLNRSDGIHIYGQVIDRGKQVSPPELGYGVVCFDTQGHPTIEIFQCPDDTQTSFAGRTILIKDGQINTSLRDTMRHPRLAIGFNDNEMIVIGVEGRHPNSQGATYPELASIMRENGAMNAIELDGGGSMSMVYRSESGSEIQVNSPVDRLGPFRSARPVFGIRFIESSTNQ